MKNNVLLAFLIVVLAVLLLLLRLYFVYIPSILFIMAFIALYCTVMHLGKVFIKRESHLSTLQSDEKPFVNIVIPAHNEEFVLEKTIENLLMLDYPNYDILIMDDRSVDKTSEIAQRLSEKHSIVRCFTRPQSAFPGKSAVLNDALDMTDEELICVFDADVKVEKDFLTKIVPYTMSENVAAVQARKVISNKEYNILTRCQYYEYCSDSNIQVGRDYLGTAVELRGNGEILKRSVVNAIGGWNNHSITDDLDLSTKIHLNGYDIRFCDNIYVYEEAITSFKPIVKQRKRWAEGSIRRYLDYAFQLIFSQKVRFRVKLDALAYFSEFVLPMWIVFDLCIQLFMFVLGKHPTFFFDLTFLSLVGLFFGSILFVSIRKYDSIGVLESLKWSICTSLYLIVLWLIVVFVVVAKIIFLKRDMCWNKTEHLGDNSNDFVQLNEGN